MLYTIEAPQRMAEIHQSDQNAPPAALGRAAALALLTLVIIGFYWKLVLTDQFTWLAGGDIANQVLPWMQFQAGEWHAGRLPLWDPNHWGGQPLIGQAQPGVVYPLNWILFSLPLRNGWLKPTHLHWYFVLIHLMAAWFAYLLARDLKLSRAASVFSATVFSLAGWMGTTDWPQMLNGAVWAPLVFLFLLRAARGERLWASSALGGLFLGLAWLSGHHQIPIYISLAAAGVWLWAMWRRPKLILAAALFFVIAGAAGAAQILPALEYGKHSVRWVGASEPVGWDRKVPYDVHRTYSFHPVSVLGILFPGMSMHADANLGVTALLLALLGVAFAWRQRMEARVMALIALGGLLFSLSHYNPMHGVLYSLVPLVDKARSASMAVFIFGLGMAMLAGYGLDALLSRPDHAWVRRAGIAALSMAIVVYLIRAAGAMWGTIQPGSDQRYMLTALAGLLLAALLAAFRLGTVGTKTVFLCLLGLFFVEISSTNTYFLPTFEEKDRVKLLRALAEHGDIAAFLRAQPGPFRVDVDEKEIQYNFGDWHGLHQMGGYLASLTTHFRVFETHSTPGRRLLGAAYAVRREPTEFYRDAVFTGRSGAKVFYNRDVMPRAFAVHELTSLPHAGHIMPEMNKMSSEEMSRRALLVGPAPALEQCAGADSVRVLVYHPSRVEIATDMACKGMVVLTDTTFPGWVATVDGQRAEIHELYGVVRGVVVERGTHTVEFRYRPMGVWAGAVLGGLALLVSLGILLAGRHRQPT